VHILSPQTNFKLLTSLSYTFSQPPSNNRKIPFEEVQQWVKKRVDKKPVQDPPSSPAYKAEPPVYTVEPPAFMARRRTAELFTPEGRRNFVMKHLRLDPLTAATYEQAIQDGTHMVGMQGYGDLCETP